MRYSRRQGRTLGAIACTVLIAVWEVVSRIYGSDLLPAPTQVLVAFWNLLISGELFRAAAASVARVVIGFIAAAFFGCASAVLMSSVPLIRASYLPIIEFLRPISPIAWIPIAIAWFGIGDHPAYFIVFIAAVYPIILNTILGIQNISESHMSAARSFGANWRLRLTDVAWPSAKPSVLAGLRLGLGIGWMSLIAAELIGVTNGLGYLIEVNRRLLRLDNVIAVMATIGAIGSSLNSLLQIYAKRTTPWLVETDGL